MKEFKNVEILKKSDIEFKLEGKTIFVLNIQDTFSDLTSDGYLCLLKINEDCPQVISVVTNEIYYRVNDV